MSFQTEKRKSLSDRFASISSADSFSNNKDLIQRLHSTSQQGGDKKKNENSNSNCSENRKENPGTLKVHLKINQINHQRRDNSYVNRPHQPLRMECRDQPSELTRELNRNSAANGSREKFRGYGRQVSVKDTLVKGPNRNDSTSPVYNRCNGMSDQYSQNCYNLTSPGYSQNVNNQTSPGYNNCNDQTSPRNSSFNNQTSPRYSSCNNQTSPRYSSCHNQTSPQLSQTVIGNKNDVTSPQGPLNFGQRDCLLPDPPNRSPQIVNGYNQCQNFNQNVSQSTGTINVGNRLPGGHYEQRPPSILGEFSFNKHILGQVEQEQSTNFIHKTPEFQGNFDNTEHVDYRILNQKLSSTVNKDPRGYQHGAYANNTPSNIGTNNLHRPFGVHQDPFFPSSYSQLNSNGNQSQFIQSGPFCNKSPRNVQCQSTLAVPYCNKSPGNVQSTHSAYIIDDYNYNEYNNPRSHLVQGAEYNMHTSGLPLEKSDQVNKSPGTLNPFGDKIYLPNQQKSAQVSPTFSSNSEMSLDSNTVDEQSKENVKPTGFYTDLTNEVFPEVEALKKKFFEECDGLTSTPMDEKIVHVVKNILETTTDLAVQCSKKSPGIVKAAEQCSKKSPGIVKAKKGLSAAKSNVLPSKFLIDENGREEAESLKHQRKDSSARSPLNEDKFSAEMKFEGRTLLKGGVKPRHIPKMLINKPGLGPPTDRRAVYLTARNLLELPLPRWSAEVLNKSIQEQDISNGNNPETKRSSIDKDVSMAAENKTLLEKLDRNHKNSGEKKVENNSVKRVSGQIPNKAGPGDDKISNVKTENIKKAQIPKKDEQLKSSKKMKTDAGKKIDMTLDGTVVRNKDTNNTAGNASSVDKDLKLVNGLSFQKDSNGQSSTASDKKNKQHGEKKNAESSRRDQSNSRESSRSRRSRSRDSSRSRNRSRSRERRPWRYNKQQDSQYKRSNHSDYRSRSRDVLQRSPMKKGNKPFAKHEFQRDDIASAIMKQCTGKSWQYNDVAVKNTDMYDFDRNGFRSNEEFHFIESR